MPSSKPKPTGSEPEKARRRPKATSSAGLLVAMVNASKGLLQPLESAPVRAEAMKFWPAIITARTRDEWDEVSLVIASQLAECQCAIMEQTAEVNREGYMLRKGNDLYANPRASLIEALSRREMALMRSLRFGGRISGDTRHDAVKRQVEKNARQALESLAEDELLA